MGNCIHLVNSVVAYKRSGRPNRMNIPFSVAYKSVNRLKRVKLRVTYRVIQTSARQAFLRPVGRLRFAVEKKAFERGN
jgi:hypothetical protein